jgi:hypothetical protein
MERFVYEIHEGDELISRGDVDKIQAIRRCYGTVKLLRKNISMNYSA